MSETSEGIGAGAEISETGKRAISSQFQIKFRKNFQSTNVVHHLIDAQEQVAILDHDVIELLIVDNQLSGSVLLPYKEHWSCEWAVCVGRFGPSCSEHLV
jgi:hypothetical protein